MPTWWMSWLNLCADTCTGNMLGDVVGSDESAKDARETAGGDTESAVAHIDAGSLAGVTDLSACAATAPGSASPCPSAASDR